MVRTGKLVLYFLLFLILLILFASILGYDRTNIPNGTAGETMEIGRSKIRVQQTGSGTDILMIHGTPGSIEDWDVIVESVPQGYRITRYDRPGYGFSENNDMNSALSLNTDIAVSLIKKLNLSPVIIVAHNYGASVALNLMMTYPDTVKSAVLLNPASYPVPDLTSDLRLFTIPVLGRGMASLAVLISGNKIEKKITNESFYPNSALIPDDYSKARSKLWLQAKVIKTIASELSQHYMDFDANSSGYRHITHPISIIHGTEDRMVPVEQSLQLEKDLRYARLILLENIGHQVPYARPDLVIQEIRRLTH